MGIALNESKLKCVLLFYIFLNARLHDCIFKRINPSYKQTKYSIRFPIVLQYIPSQSLAPSLPNCFFFQLKFYHRSWIPSNSHFPFILIHCRFNIVTFHIFKQHTIKYYQSEIMKIKNSSS